MVPRILKPLCQGTGAAATGEKILISRISIVHLLMMNSLTLVAWLVSEKPFHVKEFQKTLLILLHVPGKKAHSLIMSQPGENGLASVLNKKLILFRNL